MKTTTKTGKNVTIRVVKGTSTCHAVIVARNGRIIAESDTMRPAFDVAGAERDGLALAARI
jgi:hypothetical protein